jgi:hypothetical protein
LGVEEEAVLVKEDPLEGSKVTGEAFELEEEEGTATLSSATLSSASVAERRTGDSVKGVFSAKEEGSGVPEVTMVEK